MQLRDYPLWIKLGLIVLLGEIIVVLVHAVFFGLPKAILASDVSGVCWELVAMGAGIMGLIMIYMILRGPK